MGSKVVVSLTVSRQFYQQKQAEEARRVAQRHGAAVEVSFAEGSSADQRQHLLERIGAPAGERPGALIVQPLTADGLEGVARAALQARIAWILLYAPPPYMGYLGQEFPGVPLAHVSADNVQIGEVQARQMNALLPLGGKVLSIEGAGGSASTLQRTTGMLRGIRDTQIVVAKSIGSDWTRERTERMVSWWLASAQAFRPDLVVAQNDSMAGGAMAAIASARPSWGKIPAIGVDGQEEGLVLMRSGVLAATVEMPITAGIGVELALRAMRGEPVAPVAVPVKSVPEIESLGPRG